MSRLDPYRHRYHSRYSHQRRRWHHRRRRDTAGTFLIVMFALMALCSLGSAPERRGQRLSGASAGPIAPGLQQGLPPALVNTPTPDAPPVAELEREGQREEAGERQGNPPGPFADAATDAPSGCSSSECLVEFAAYGAAPGGKAFTLSRNGQGFWAAGEESISIAARKALQSCHESSGQPCEVMAVAGAGS